MKCTIAIDVENVEREEGRRKLLYFVPTLVVDCIFLLPLLLLMLPSVLLYYGGETMQRMQSVCLGRVQIGYWGAEIFPSNLMVCGEDGIVKDVAFDQHIFCLT